jgi:hypothetical protein
MGGKIKASVASLRLARIACGWCNPQYDSTYAVGATHKLRSRLASNTSRLEIAVLAIVQLVPPTIRLVCGWCHPQIPSCGWFAVGATHKSRLGLASNASRVEIAVLAIQQK